MSVCVLWSYRTKNTVKINVRLEHVSKNAVNGLIERSEVTVSHLWSALPAPNSLQCSGWEG